MAKKYVCRKCKNSYYSGRFRPGYLICKGCEKVIKKEKTKFCPGCNRELPLVEFREGYNRKCNNCHRINMNQYSIDPRIRMWRSSKANASLKGREHTIRYDQIKLPKKCVYLGVLLDYAHPDDREGYINPNMATLDRVDSSKGYIPGNVQVISHLANRMKNNATVDELVKFAKNVLKLHGK